MTKGMSFILLIFFFATLPTASLSSLLVGVVTNDAAIICSSSVLTKNGLAMREDFDWIRQLGENCLVGVQGDSSDSEFLLMQLESSNRDHELKFGSSLSCRSIAHLCRRIISKFLRSNQLKVSVLIGGWNSNIGRPSLYWLDSIGTNCFSNSNSNHHSCITELIMRPKRAGAIQEVPYAAHGEGFSFVLGLLDSINRVKSQSSTDKGTEILVKSSAFSYQDLKKKDKSEPSLSEKEIAVIRESPNEIDSMSEPYSSRFSLIGKENNDVKGSILRMNIAEGVSTVRSCMDAARKRTTQILGPCRVKGVTGSGCRDLGFV